MAWNEAERRTWLFPPVGGEWDGHQLEHLDLSTPGHRSIVVGNEPSDSEHRWRGGHDH